LISAQQLASSSVAIQGLSAMECLLFDDGMGTPGNFLSKPHLCLILQRTAGNLVLNARKLNRPWQNEFPYRWLNLDREKQQPGYLKRNVESLFSGLVMALDLIKGPKLGKPLGMKQGKKHQGKLNPWQLESWRSRTSLDQIQTTLIAARKLYEMELGLSWCLTQKSPAFRSLDQEIRQRLKDTIAIVTEIDGHAFELLRNNQSEQLEALYQSMSQLHGLLKIDYASTADIQYRFNAKDGD
jgi:hypothetical protein